MDNFRASYFAGALMINRNQVKEELKDYKKWVEYESKITNSPTMDQTIPRLPRSIRSSLPKAKM